MEQEPVHQSSPPLDDVMLLILETHGQQTLELLALLLLGTDDTCITVLSEARILPILHDTDETRLIFQDRCRLEDYNFLFLELGH